MTTSEREAGGDLPEQLAGREDQRAEGESRCQPLHDEPTVRSGALAAQESELEQLLERYADHYEHSPIGYIGLDTSGLIRDLNLTCAALFGIERPRMIDRPLRLHVAPDDRRRFLDHMLRCRESAGHVKTELSLIIADGRRAPVLLISRRAEPTEFDGPIFRTAIFDLTELRAAEAAVRLEHQRLALALSASGAGLYEYAWPQLQLVPSDRWIALVGGEAGGAAPVEGWWRWFAARISPDDAAERDRLQAAFLAGASLHYTVEFRFSCADGRTIWLREFAQAAERDLYGHARRVVGALIDVTEDKRRVAEAEQRTAQLRALSTALFRVEENERRELASLLHDDLGQRLVAVKLRLGALLAEHGLAGLTEVIEMLDQTHRSVRSLTFQLSPPILRDLGLVPGLRWLAREMEKQFGLEVAVDADEPLPPLGGDPNYLLFRCVRELLFNVVKHARAQAARIELRTEEGCVAIAVEDPGVGFDPTRASGERHERHSFGLLSVRERVEGLGGRVIVDAEPGRGTRVVLRVPVAR